MIIDEPFRAGPWIAIAPDGSERVVSVREHNGLLVAPRTEEQDYIGEPVSEEYWKNYNWRTVTERYFDEYNALLDELIRLSKAGQGEGEEADQIRDKIESIFFELSWCEVQYFQTRANQANEQLKQEHNQNRSSEDSQLSKSVGNQ